MWKKEKQGERDWERVLKKEKRGTKRKFWERERVGDKKGGERNGGTKRKEKRSRRRKERESAGQKERREWERRTWRKGIKEMDIKRTRWKREFKEEKKGVRECLRERQMALWQDTQRKSFFANYDFADASKSSCLYPKQK